ASWRSSTTPCGNCIKRGSLCCSRSRPYRSRSTSPTTATCCRPGARYSKVPRERSRPTSRCRRSTWALKRLNNSAPCRIHVAPSARADRCQRPSLERGGASCAGSRSLSPADITAADRAPMSTSPSLFDQARCGFGGRALAKLSGDVDHLPVTTTATVLDHTLGLQPVDHLVNEF